MSLIKSFVLVLAALASVDALSTYGRSINHHALGRRLPKVLDTKVTGPMRRRSLHKRCKVRPSLPASAGVVGNVGSAPTPTKGGSKPTDEATTPKPSPTRSAVSTPKTTKHPSSGGGGSLPSYLSGTNTGDATYYGVGLGACGYPNTDGDMIVAVSHLLYDNFPGYKGGNPNNNPVCGKWIRASLRGKHVDVQVADRCTGCSLEDLDFSPAAFNKIGNPTTGREHGMTWEWIEAP